MLFALLLSQSLSDNTIHIAYTAGIVNVNIATQ